MNMMFEILLTLYLIVAVWLAIKFTLASVTSTIEGQTLGYRTWILFASIPFWPLLMLWSLIFPFICTLVLADRD